VPRVFRTVRRLLFGLLMVGALVVAGTGFRVWQVARLDDRAAADVVVVLGAAQYAGTPSLAFRARLQHAKTLFDEGVSAQIATTGGRQPGDRYTEAEAGKRWLVAAGVPAENVVALGEGHDTLGSLRAVADVAGERQWHSAVVVSDPWHSLRARTMAADVGLDTWTSPTHRGPMVQTRQTQVRYIVRETAALLYYRITKAPANDLVNDLGGDVAGDVG